MQLKLYSVYVADFEMKPTYITQDEYKYRLFLGAFFPNTPKELGYYLEFCNDNNLDPLEVENAMQYGS